MVSQNRISHSALGYLAALLAAASWGTSSVFLKLVFINSGVTALSLAFWRDLTTFLVLLVGLLLFRPDLLRAQRRDLRWLIAMGVTLGIFHVFWNLAVMLNGAAVATVQQAAMPAIASVVAWFIWREPLTWRKILAIVLTFAGTGLASGIDALGQMEVSPAGLLAGMAVTLLYAGWNLLGKKARQSNNALTVLAYAFGFGALVLLPFQFFTEQPWPVSPIALLWFVAFIGVSTLLGFTIYTYALGHLPASVASILAMSEVAFVMVYAYFLLDERLAAVQIMGAVLVVVGVALLFRRK